MEGSGDGGEAISQLEGYSLVNRSAKAPTFSVHRLVQEVGRLWQQQPDEPEQNELENALGWLNAAFAGNPQDVRSWLVLDPLTPHAKAVAGFADQAGITNPTVRLIGVQGSLLFCKAAYSNAEPLMRRALAIDEASYGTDHPEVARDLNNLAQLLKATNRLAEAEPLMRRVVEIFITLTQQGYQHPYLEAAFGNYYSLLQEMDFPESEIKAKLQSLLAPSS
jgi:tetratricopeptide (TPR) repeat protein